MEESQINSIIQDIKKSKKYKNVYDKTIERIVRDFCAKGGAAKEIEKKSKNLLHQIWGAFYAQKPNFKKLLLNLQKNVQEHRGILESVLPILQAQSSVKERIPILDDFYKKIFEVTGIPNTIIDYACGLNPLTYFWMRLPESTMYKAFDIDEDQIIFLRAVFTLLKIPTVQVALQDVLIDSFESADVIFLLKLLPCLEHQKKDSSLEIIKNLSCKYVVVSFPIKSLSGKKSGMADFYSNNFKKMVEQEQLEFTEILFETELVFVIKK